MKYQKFWGVKKLFKKLLNDEKGQGMVEYGIIIALIAVVALGGLTLLRGTEGTGSSGTHPGTGLMGLIGRIRKALTSIF